ncbi:hypothetical protein EJ02DRAFT_461589 [Clathrospora elynae]|uniref:Uncharacterized protein n=1 Tax=Clathrospora elynae TaxID=706981 RepID=A0A6A5T6S7_9PLEO|nr:hypothetical protein EJ02DRAFT_461589 [Clathrospora elynae]
MASGLQPSALQSSHAIPAPLQFPVHRRGNTYQVIASPWLMAIPTPFNILFTGANTNALYTCSGASSIGEQLYSANLFISWTIKYRPGQSLVYVIVNDGFNALQKRLTIRLEPVDAVLFKKATHLVAIAKLSTASCKTLYPVAACILQVWEETLLKFRLLHLSEIGIAASVFVEQEISKQRMVQAELSAMIFWDIDNRVQLVQNLMNALCRNME